LSKLFTVLSGRRVVLGDSQHAMRNLESFATEPVERDGITHTFVVDDIAGAVESAKQPAKDSLASLLGGKMSRQCLFYGLVDELHLGIAPVLLGRGISLFEGLGQRIELERAETSAFASEVHLVCRALH